MKIFILVLCLVFLTPDSLCTTQPTQPICLTSPPTTPHPTTPHPTTPHPTTPHPTTPHPTTPHPTTTPTHPTTLRPTLMCNFGTNTFISQIACPTDGVYSCTCRTDGFTSLYACQLTSACLAQQAHDPRILCCNTNFCNGGLIVKPTVQPTTRPVTHPPTNPTIPPTHPPVFLLSCFTGNNNHRVQVTCPTNKVYSCLTKTSIVNGHPSNLYGCSVATDCRSLSLLDPNVRCCSTNLCNH